MNSDSNADLSHSRSLPLAFAGAVLFLLLAGCASLFFTAFFLRFIFAAASVAIVAGLAWFTFRNLRNLETRNEEQRKRVLSTAKFAALGEVAAGMAHEINTPLGAIMLSSSQLKDLIPENAEHKEMIFEIIEDVLSSSEKISRIVRGLRSFSRDTSQTADFVFCDLPTVLQESLALCEASLRRQGVALKLCPLPANLDLQCNPSQLSQVIINLVNNARDAVATQNEKWVEIKLSFDSDKVEIRVTDSGPGIPMELRAKLFKTFFTTKEIGKGTGLGLSIVQGIVQQHRGEIFLDEKNEHTSFVLRLPRIQAK